MELRQITYFLEIMKTGKLSEAAENLYVTQPAITTSIKNLENELEVKLFDRDHSGFTPTEAGLIFAEHASKIVKEIDKAVKNLSNYKNGIDRTMEINIPAVSCGTIYPLIYRNFKEKHPGINFVINDIYSSESIKKVINDDAEFGFCIYRDEYKDILNFVEVDKGEISLLVQKNGPFSNYTSVPLANLSDTLWILNRRTNSSQTATELAVLDYFKKSGLDVPKIKYIEDHHTIINTISMGIGVYPYPNTSNNDPFGYYQDVESKRIDNGLFYRVGLVYKKSKKLSRSAQTFITWVKEIAWNQTHKTK